MSGHNSGILNLIVLFMFGFFSCGVLLIGIKILQKISRKKNPITSEAVEYAYRILLDREPENRRAVLKKVAECDNYKDLRKKFIFSMD